jgi:hypothetical protein
MCSQIVDASSTADLRFSPTTGTIPQTIETVLRASMAALILLMLRRVRCEGSTGGMAWDEERAGRRERSTGGAAAPLAPPALSYSGSGVSSSSTTFLSHASQH